MFAVKSIPELARDYRDQELTPAEIEMIYGADPPTGNHGTKPGCVPGKSPTQTCSTDSGCVDDGADCW